jgi:DNA-binding NarL/FixJ family response regulator
MNNQVMAMTDTENSDFETSDIQHFAALEDTASAIEAERRRLAGMVQGHIIEPLNLLLAQAHVYEQTLGASPQARMAVSVLASLARQTLQQARDLEANLHPAILETLGLEAALETLASQEMRTRNISIKLQVQRMAERLPPPVELALFRVTQDVMHQAVREQASQISIHLECRDEWLDFFLSHNGLGDEASETALLASRQRIESLGGTFENESSPEDGATFNIYFPMKSVAELTAREMEVIQSLVQGLSNKQIALALGVSARTVNFHLDNIYSKLGVSTRTEAAIYALRQGWVTG